MPLAAAFEVAPGVLWVVPTELPVELSSEAPLSGCATPLEVAREVGTSELLDVEDALSPYPIVGSGASALTCQALVVNSGHAGGDNVGL
jgi:hypothetical protein